MRTFLLLFFLGIGVSFGQISELSRGSVPSYDSQVGTVFEEVPIQGSPYFNERYVVGNTVVNGKSVRLLMRYNAYSDQIEMKDKYQKSFNLLKRTDLEATFGGKIYRMLAYAEDGEEKKGYFNPLNSGFVKLYHKPKKVFVQAEKPDNGYDEFDPPVFKDVSAYYLQVGSQPLVKINLNKRQLLKHLKEESVSVRKYVEENNLKLKTEEEIVRLLNFHNQNLVEKKGKVNS
ncbi:MAG: hypothetical protein AB3N14_13495 [Flavobacteriaceae bacterium]